MTRAEFQKMIESGTVILDGATGSNLRNAGMPVVAVGDTVSAGQLIAKCPDGALGSAIHASISGRVVSVKDTIEISSTL